MEVESVEVEDERRLTLVRFEAALKVIKSLPPNGPFQPSNDMMLKFYSYYKQATVGACNIPRPGFWDAVGKAKWDAWSSLEDMSKEKAMAGYVDEMKLILEGMPMTDEVEELLRVLGPFYELIDDRKKITQISDLSMGFGSMVNAMPSKSIAKSIVRTMKMNGTLETRPARLKKKGSTKRNKVPLSNGKVSNGVTHLTNGSHPKAGLNGVPSQEGSVAEPLLNGHHTDPGLNVSGPSQLASDSDSEVYCDSVDQFGQEESSEHNQSLDDLDEDENHVLSPLEEPQDDVDGAPEGIMCGGEDGENGGTVSQRQRLNADMSNSSLVRREGGSRSPGHGSGSLMPMYGGGDGDRERWGGAVTPGGSLNEQIVVALARLQEDMQSVLERLHTLEALTASQARSMSLSPTCGSTPVNKKSRKPSWWPFDISPTSLAFAVIWPFVVQWLIRLYLQRRRRRIN
ncbi:Acyl-CoA-binding domain containing protein 5A [Dissostichus eleginoides]|uniref:Acyl-CoA-binding domain containing protein 5A n=1 Tax=Dissostichus eleginoides TaxID=100907 RepID=A0AAD9F0K1_DISEL|nr:Acyl-CoA-binding domain containing protein 5A [Dissostichus eleginoides]